MTIPFNKTSSIEAHDHIMRYFLSNDAYAKIETAIKTTIEMKTVDLNEIGKLKRTSGKQIGLADVFSYSWSPYFKFVDGVNNNFRTLLYTRRKTTYEANNSK